MRDDYFLDLAVEFFLLGYDAKGRGMSRGEAVGQLVSKLEEIEKLREKNQ